jgi:putative transposase
MPQYRRYYVPGGTFFCTVNLADRNADLLVRNIACLRDAVREVRAGAAFALDAWVVLPDHLHCIWTLPEGDTDYSGRWREIKKRFAKRLPASEPRMPVMTRRGERGIWQKRYWEHMIRDARDYRAHIDDVHFNPVKHGLSEHPAAWPHSSFLRAVAAGMYAADWAIPAGGAIPMEAGER